jgi:hypothetical protein
MAGGPAPTDDLIFVEILTLDSHSCPCCWYMVDVLRTLRPEARELIRYQEWPIKTREGVARFGELGGRVIPTLCVDERRVFESVIPSLDELYGALIDAARSDEQRAVLQEAYRQAQDDYENPAGGQTG